MPYLNYLFCEKCGPPVNLDLDQIETINAYIAENRKTTYLDDRTLMWDYLVYSCSLCNTHFKYSYRDVELRVRKYLISKYADLRDSLNLDNRQSNVALSSREKRRVTEMYRE